MSDVIEKLSLEEAYKQGNEQFLERMQRASYVTRASYRNSMVHLIGPSTKEYTDNLYDLVANNKPMTLIEKTDFETCADKTLVESVCYMEQNYHIKDIQKAYTIRFGTVMMLEQGDRKLAVQTIQDYQNHLTKFRRDMEKTMHDFAFNTQQAQFGAILSLREKATAAYGSDIIQPLNPRGFENILYFR